MAAFASQQRPNLSVDVGLAQTSGKHPRQSSRAQVHADRSAQAPRTQPRQQQQRQQQQHYYQQDQGGFYSDDDAYNGDNQAQGVAGQYDDPVDSSDEEERRAAQAHGPRYQDQQQQRRRTDQDAYAAEYHNGVDDHSYADESDSMSRAQVGSSMDHDQEEEEDGFEDDDMEEEEEEGDDDELSSSPSIPDENINFDLVYALHNFPATVEGQATVIKGHSLTLLDDSNSYWWLVRVLRTQEVGYIPAENVETPFERLARLNKHRNVDITVATDDDVIQVPSRIFSSHLVKQRDAIAEAGRSKHSGKLSALSRRRDGAPMASPTPQGTGKPSVVFGPDSYVEHSGDEYESDEEGEYEDEEGDYEEDGEEGEEGEMDEDQMRAQMEQEHSYDTDTSDPDVRGRGADGMADTSEASTVTQSRPNASVIPTTAAGKKAFLDKMEPDDGMDWDAHEGLKQQQQAEAGSGRAPNTFHPDTSVQSQDAHSRQDPAQLARGSGPLQQQPQGSTGDDTAGMSHGVSDRSIASMTSSAGEPAQTQGNRNRAVSNGSEMSQLSSTTSTASVKDKDQKRKSKGGSIDGSEEPTFNDDKSTKKRSGVFSGLFSRNKDKKDRKSGSFSSAGGSTLGGHQDNIVVTRPSTESARAREASPSVAGPTGLSRTVQERDRATQDAYSRQFLGDRSGSLTDSLSPRQGKQRPGSLIATPNSAPMLNVVRVFAGEGIHSDSTFKTVLLNDTTSARDLVKQATQRFRLHEENAEVQYLLTVKLLEGNERALGAEEKPLQVFDRLCQMAPDEAAFMPSIKRSSIGSISSISSNLSLNPAIARVNGDFSDDHSVKFFLTRVMPGSRNDLAVEPDLDSGPSYTYGDPTYFSDASKQKGVAPALSSAFGRPQSLSTSNPDSTLLQAPTARFALRLLIFPSELPEGTVFDPQTNALIPTSVLAERGPGGSVPSEYVEQRFREKVLSLANNATVAEVIETGLDRFGIMEGVVEGGDDVGDRSSRRKTRGRIQYGLTVDTSKGGPAHEKSLAPNSKVLDAYPVPPIFKTSTANKRRSTDSAMLLSMAEEQIRSDDPVFVLRAVSSHAHAHGKHGKAVRALSPTEGRLVNRQEQQRQADINTYKATTSEADDSGILRRGQSSPTQVLGQSSGPVTPRSKQQEVIAAQRAAAKERKAAVLGAQRNDVRGVDLYLDNKARIRSSRSLEGTVRYSYLPDSMQESEMDISAIVEDVLADQDPARSGDYLDAGNARPAGPARDASTVTLNTFHSPPSTPSGLAAPLDPKEAHIEWRSRSQAGSTAPLSLGSGKGTKAAGPSHRDLLETFVRNPNAEESTIEDRIDSVLSRVARDGGATRQANAGSQVGRTPGRRTPTTGQTASEEVAQTPSAYKAAGAPVETTGDTFGGRNTADTYSGKSGVDSEVSHDGTTTTSPTPVSTAAPVTVATAAARNLPTGAIVTSQAANVTRGLDVSSSRGMPTPRPSSPMRISPSSYGPAAYIPSDDFGLDHLYTIVDAAMRRDPAKYIQVPTRARSTTPGSKRLSGLGSPSLASPHQFAQSMTFQLAPSREPLRPQDAGLFFVPPASMTTNGEDKIGAERYAPVNRQLGQMEDTLDQLLADVMKVF